MDNSRPSKLAPYCRTCESDKRFTPYSYQPIEGEEWRAIPNYEGTYSVSNFGRVRREVTAYRGRKGGLLAQTRGSHGYPAVRLTMHNHGKNHTVHSLVMAAFAGPCPEGHNINHKDGIKSNTLLTNLEYVTPKENAQHAVRLGLTKHGDEHHLSKITQAEATKIYKLAHGGHLKQKDIASMFGVHQSMVAYIKHGKKWKESAYYAALS